MSRARDELSFAVAVFSVPVAAAPRSVPRLDESDAPPGEDEADALDEMDPPVDPPEGGAPAVEDEDAPTGCALAPEAVSELVSVEPTEDAAEFGAPLGYWLASFESASGSTFGNGRLAILRILDFPAAMASRFD